MQCEDSIRLAKIYANKYNVDWSAFTEDVQMVLDKVAHECYADGIHEGSEIGFINGKNEGYDDGYCEGYAAGVEDAIG
jgi:flagellar biosynthesis/type III secretory pathway protein FliH